MQSFKAPPQDQPPVADDGGLSRRQFVQGIAGVGLSAAGLALLAGCGRLPAGPVAAEAPLETTRLRLVRSFSICQAPQLVGEELLGAKGSQTCNTSRQVAAGPR